MTTLRYRFHTHEFGEQDIHVRTLRDVQQFEDASGEAEKLNICSASWPHFGVIWPSGEVLAHLLQDFDIAGKRILEIGCGIGLPSLVLKLRQGDITATDHHPEAGTFLEFNTALNDMPTIPFIRSDWLLADDPVQADLQSSTLGRFDLLVGSDILYEPHHIDLLSAFIMRHANEHCEVVVVDPGRRQHGRFRRIMVELGFIHHQDKPLHTDYLDKPFKGQILYFRRDPTTASENA